MADRLQASFAGSTAEIDAATWNGLAQGADPHGNPFLDHAFFLALERSGCATSRTGWSPRHVVLRDGGEIVGLMPMFEKTHSQGEYVFDHGWANAFEEAGGRYYPKLQVSLPFTPVTAPKLWSRDPAFRPHLLTAAEAHAEAAGNSSIHATFVTEDEADLARDAGWLPRTDTQYHWHNQGFGSFEHYLETLSSRHRKVTRRERRDALDGLTVRWLSGADLTEAAWSTLR